MTYIHLTLHYWFLNTQKSKKTAFLVFLVCNKDLDKVLWGALLEAAHLQLP
jgi:hypothetical protein